MNHPPDFLEKKLLEFLPPDRFSTRAIDRYARAGDASFYWLLPKAVVFPANLIEIAALFRFSQKEKIPLTFRAAGTSLSGQAISDGLLVDISRHWRDVKLEANGQQIRVQPGVIGGYANAILKKFGTKIGPDPASINAAMIGGILANNSSGMCCGVAQNSYHTLRFLKIMLPDGLVFSTENEADFERFEKDEARIAQKLTDLRNQILENQPLADRIRQKYRQKNTVGYCLNAFLDFEKPLDILAHLMIGSEGTLGFIAEAVLETVPDFPFKKTGLLPFSSAKLAGEAVPSLVESGARALELMDWNSIRAIRDLDGAPIFLQKMPPGSALLLTEFQEETAEKLATIFEKAAPILEKITAPEFESVIQNSHSTMASEPESAIRNPQSAIDRFTQNAAEQHQIWKLRKGLYPSVATLRKSGSTVLLEDLTFPVSRLGEAVEDLQILMEKHGFPDGIVMGHAKDGNLHFIVSQRLDSKNDIADYGKLMAELVELTLKKYDGALKGEHGTGRNMAPFVEAEWGREALEIMREIKRTIDPDGLLNPGVIINDDPEAHLKNLKKLPTVEPEVDKCVECGFCENRCPSRDLTLTPRQRIQVRRAMKQLSDNSQLADLQALAADFEYSALDTCAVDGLCATDCPVDINTGELVKKLRSENHSPRQNRLAILAVKNSRLIEILARFGIRSGLFFQKIMGENSLVFISKKIRKWLPASPVWLKSLALRNGRSSIVNRQPSIVNEKSAIRPERLGQSAVIYFAACVTRMMGRDTVEHFQSVAQKAGFEAVMPKNLTGSCCGQAFSSKGFTEASSLVFNETIEKCAVWSDGGRLPIVLDVTSCTQTLRSCRPFLTAENQALFDRLTILDSLEFLRDFALPRLVISKKISRVILHPVCSLQKMKLDGVFLQIAKSCAGEVIVPTRAGCCGMAGDRGFLRPELTASATRFEALDVEEIGPADGYFSSACTCELAMSEATGQAYFSILKLVDEVAS